MAFLKQHYMLHYMLDSVERGGGGSSTAQLQMEAEDVQKTKFTLMIEGKTDSTDAREDSAGFWLYRKLRGSKELLWKPKRCTLLCVSLCVVLTITVCAATCKWCQQEGIPKQCGREWLLYGGKCYLFWEKEHDWESCQAFCAEKGSKMLSFQSQEEMASVSKYLRIEECWLGLPSGAGPSSSSENPAALGKDLVKPEGTSECAYVADSSTATSGCSVFRHCLCMKNSPDMP